MRLLDDVAVTANLPDRGLVRGQVGVIVEELDESTVLVEFADLTGASYAVEPIPVSVLLGLKHGPPAAGAAGTRGAVLLRTQEPRP